MNIKYYCLWQIYNINYEQKSSPSIHNSHNSLAQLVVKVKVYFFLFKGIKKKIIMYQYTLLKMNWKYTII